MSPGNHTVLIHGLWRFLDTKFSRNLPKVEKPCFPFLLLENPPVLDSGMPGAYSGYEFDFCQGSRNKNRLLILSMDNPNVSGLARGEFISIEATRVETLLLAICGFCVLAFLFSLYLHFRTYELWGALGLFFLKNLAHHRIYSSVSDYGYRIPPLAKEFYFYGRLQVGSDEFFAEDRRG